VLDTLHTLAQPMWLCFGILAEHLNTHLAIISKNDTEDQQTAYAPSAEASAVHGSMFDI